jgi:hypothetical protein
MISKEIGRKMSEGRARRPRSHHNATKLIAVQRAVKIAIGSQTSGARIWANAGE